MFNVITAIGNETINNELRSLKKYNIVYGDVIYQEALLEILQNNNIDKLLVYDELAGALDKYKLIENILDINRNVDIIVILDKKDKEFTNFLLSKGIFKIINSDEITIDLICKTIDNKIENEKEKGLYNEIDKLKEKIQNVDKHIVNKPFNKKIITVNGTSGSGKTSFLVNLALILAQEYNKKVLIFDLDIITASVDKLLDIPMLNKNLIDNLDTDKKCVLNYLINCMQKNNFDFDILMESVIQYSKQKNVHIITGNTSMFVCENILCIQYYSKILEKAKELYDYILIDTNSCMFLDSTKWALENADVIYYLFEGTYKDFTNMKSSLVIYKKAWDILYDKFEFVLNKHTKYSLSKMEISNLDNTFNIHHCIKYNEKYIQAVNDNIPVIYKSITEKENYEKILGIQNEEHIIKNIYKNIKEVFNDNKAITKT